MNDSDATDSGDDFAEKLDRLRKSDTTDDNATSEAPRKPQFQFSLPPPERLLTTLGAAVMVVAPLLSWRKAGGLDAFPNLAGAGWSSGGAGLMVLVVGAILLVRRPPAGLALGRALGAMLVSLVYVLLAAEGTLAAGAWVGLVGSLLALLGIGMSLTDAANRPALKVGRAGATALGAALAAIGSFWLDWGLSWEGGTIVGGLSTDVISGFPVLILAATSLLTLLSLLDPNASERAKSMAAFHIQYSGACITVVAIAAVLGAVMTGGTVTSGPVVALVGAFLITRSVQPAEAA